MSDQAHPSFEVEEEQPSNARLAGWGVALLVVLFIVTQALVALFHQTKDERIQEMQLSPVAPALTKLRTEEKQQLTTWGWADKEHNLAREPIQKAMEQVVAEESRP